MTDQPTFELRVIESLTSPPEREDRVEFTGAGPVTTAQETLDALRATKGAAEVLARFPELERAAEGSVVAYMSQCRSYGSAKRPIVQGYDRVSDCRYWFDDNPPDGRMVWRFHAPFDGAYTMTAKFESDQGASVECKIDGQSYGPLPLFGTTTQPHPAQLSEGLHRFEITQEFGAYQFLSLTVRAPLPAGLTVVPSVLNDPTAAAVHQVERAQLTPRFTGDVHTGDTYVVNQSPNGGVIVDVGSTVTLDLRAGPTP